MSNGYNYVGGEQKQAIKETMSPKHTRASPHASERLGISIRPIRTQHWTLGLPRTIL